MAVEDDAVGNGRAGVRSRDKRSTEKPRGMESVNKIKIPDYDSRDHLTAVKREAAFCVKRNEVLSNPGMGKADDRLG